MLDMSLCRHLNSSPRLPPKDNSRHTQPCQMPFQTNDQNSMTRTLNLTLYRGTYYDYILPKSIQDYPKKKIVSSSAMIYHLTPLFSSLNVSTIMRAIRIACGFGCLLYSLYLEVSSETLKGGKDEGHCCDSLGTLSKKIYPRVVLGCHQDSM